MNDIYPEEACGLLAGSEDRVTKVFTVSNIFKSSQNYRMDAQEQLAAFMSIEKENLELLGIYHSHPQGPPYPSEVDLNEAYYPDIAYLIWAQNGQNWIFQGFLLKNHAATPINIEIEEENL
ncbi:MAG: M67 family metallopeptidase [Anaerolineales bacterium]|nr:M67 family metallopeptidase [Anaerolineales bacterium]